MHKEFSSSLGSGFGLAVGLLLGVCAVGAGYYWYNELSAEPRPVVKTVGTARQARKVALGAMQKHGVAELAQEAKAVFDADGKRWTVYGHAKTEAGKLVEVNALINVGTIDGTLHWRVTFLEIDGKGYLGK